ncbi:MAG: hypothetical protein WBH68_04270 [Erysipelotrichaceae bacterium]|jgi:NitT/TauT family transport system permease protein|nr:hypothetical protein [Erysipelotrichaceae bacterium]HCY06067.1 hypothetical protein [Erysipelotrichaceae bacterium]
MKKEHIVTVILLILIWWILAILVGNNVLIPTPIEVLHSTIKIFSDKSSYYAIYKTLVRVFQGYFLSLIIALFISILADKFNTVKLLFEPIQILTKAIPNVSYIIVTLIWLGSEGSVWVICMLVLFPVLYNNFIFTLENEDSELKDIQKIYPETFIKTTRLRTMPLLYGTFLSSSKVALGLGLKICVMAEILGQVKVGIGKHLYYARLYLDTSSLFAWTIIIIILSVIIDSIFNILIKFKEE